MQRRSHKKDNDMGVTTLQSLSKENGADIVQNATQQVFTQIYEAAKNFDAEQLSKIRNDYILKHDEACFSIILNGYTPLTLLIHDNNFKAAAFLYSRSNRTFTELELAMVTNTKWQKEYLGHPIKAAKPTTLQEYIHCVEILKPYINNLNQLPTDAPFDQDFLSACADAFIGNEKEVSAFLSAKWLPTHPDAAIFKECIAYIIGKYHPNIVIEKIWPGDCDTQQCYLKGYFAGGHLNQNAKFLNKNTHMPTKLVYDVANAMLQSKENILETIYHPSILKSLLACIDRDDIRTKMAMFLNMFTEESHGDHIGNSAIFKINDNAFSLNRYIRTYHLTYEQALLFANPSLRTWMVQGIQLIMQGKIPNNQFIMKVASLLTDSRVPTEALNQLNFSIHQRLFIDKLDRYLSDTNNANHKKRAHSFKNACKHLDSIDDMRNLIKNQVSLFKHAVKSQHHSKLKYERPYGKKGRDEFINILENQLALM